MSEEPAKREDVRTTVSLHPTVSKWAQELMAQRGYNNFSSMVADLIRQEFDRAKADQQGEPARYQMNDSPRKSPRRKSQ